MEGGQLGTTFPWVKLGALAEASFRAQGQQGPF